jgi:hypothetical protein
MLEELAFPRILKKNKQGFMYKQFRCFNITMHCTDFSEINYLVAQRVQGLVTSRVAEHPHHLQVFEAAVVPPPDGLRHFLQSLNKKKLLS